MTTTLGHEEEPRTAESTKDEGVSRDPTHEEVRRALGVTGSRDLPTMSEAVLRSGVGWYPLLALGVFVAIDEASTSLLSTLAPEIGRSLGISASLLTLILLQKSQGFLLASTQMAAYVQRKPHRALVSVQAVITLAVLTIWSAFVTTWWGLLLVVGLQGAQTGAVYALHRPLIMDSYRPETRVRALSGHRAAQAFGAIAAPALSAVLAAGLGLSWRGVLLVMGMAFFALALIGVRLRDPGFGRWDTDAVRETVRSRSGAHRNAAAGDDTGLGFFEIVRRLWLIPTVKRVLVAWAVLGAALGPLSTYLFFYLAEHWHLGPGGRSAFLAIAWIFALPALWWFARRGEAEFRLDPARLVRLAAAIMVVVAVALVTAVAQPLFAITFVSVSVVLAASAVLVPALSVVMLSVARPQTRPHASALAGIFLYGVGGQLGLLLLQGFERRLGTGAAIGMLAVPAAIAAWVLLRASGTVNGDLDRMAGEIIEDEQIKLIKASGRHLPMLACRNVDFSYGQLQVLFGVDFAVDEGEMVALLGVNGAGKSTLLTVVSGLGLPSAGTVRFRGQDITYLDAERRVGLGITQIPGRRAVFEPMTVAENLRSFGYTFGRDRRALDAAIDRAFAAFPRLAERRNSAVATLSGGEQQMLALSKALILRPQLLLIDELSLGLAPVIVGQLLEMVRQINREGTAVVLVEQSVNIALTLVNHAYFMEKGEIRFDGRSEDLLARDDLLRAVFLQGAAARERL